MADIYLRSVPSDADPDDVRLYDPTQADSGGTLTLAPAEGAVVVAGQVASITVALAVAVGSAVIGGNAPSIASVLAPTSGSVVVGGNAPATASQLGVSTGSVVIGGQVPSIAVGSIVDPLTGVVEVTGHVPGIALATAAPEAIFWGANLGKVRRKTKEEIAEEVREEREALGILPPRVRVEVRKVLPLPDYAREQALREALDEKRIVYLERYTEALLRLAEIEARHREEEELFELLSILP